MMSTRWVLPALLAALTLACQKPRVPVGSSESPPLPFDAFVSTGVVPGPQYAHPEGPPSRPPWGMPSPTVGLNSPANPAPLKPMGHVANEFPYFASPGSLGPVFIPPVALDTPYNIVMYDLKLHEAKEVGAIGNTAIADRPYVSDNGHSLYYSTFENGGVKLRRLDLRTQLIDTLPLINTEANQSEVCLTPDGKWIAYVSGLPGTRQLRRRHLPAFSVDIGSLPPLKEQDVSFPSMSLDGSVVVYSALVNGQRDIHLYDFNHPGVQTLPFVNSPADEELPWLLPDGTTLLFTSTRRGNPDIYMADLKTGRLDDLSLVNTDAAETGAAFFGGSTIIFVSNRTGLLQLYLYDWVTHRVDTLPF